MIYRFCLLTETYNNENTYIISRPSILGNPYSHLPEDKCIAIYKCNTRDEAIESYSKYFDIMYGSNLKFTNAIDEIYEEEIGLYYWIFFVAGCSVCVPETVVHAL